MTTRDDFGDSDVWQDGDQWGRFPSGRETILKALKTCLEGITTANGYLIGVEEVRRGIHFEDNMMNRPALGFTCTKSSRKELSFGRSQRELIILIYGYIDVQPGNYDDLDDLIKQIEGRLMTESSWRFRQWTNITDYTIYEGGVHDNLGYFDMELRVTYDYVWANP